VLAAAVLENRYADADTRKRMLGIFITIGDLTSNGLLRQPARSSSRYLHAGRPTGSSRIASTGDRRTRWQRALLEELTPIAQDVARLQDDPLYQSPFTGTTPNHYCLWSSTVYLASKVFNRRDWKNLTAKVL
jgi:hypothetical protein